jgi:hypothetical protein
VRKKKSKDSPHCVEDIGMDWFVEVQIEVSFIFDGQTSNFVLYLVLK